MLKRDYYRKHRARPTNSIDYDSLRLVSIPRLYRFLSFPQFPDRLSIPLCTTVPSRSQCLKFLFRSYICCNFFNSSLYVSNIRRCIIAGSSTGSLTFFATASSFRPMFLNALSSNNLRLLWSRLLWLLLALLRLLLLVLLLVWLVSVDVPVNGTLLDAWPPLQFSMPTLFYCFGLFGLTGNWDWEEEKKRIYDVERVLWRTIGGYNQRNIITRAKKWRRKNNRKWKRITSLVWNNGKNFFWMAYVMNPIGSLGEFFTIVLYYSEFFDRFITPRESQNQHHNSTTHTIPAYIMSYEAEYD